MFFRGVCSDTGLRKGRVALIGRKSISIAAFPILAIILSQNAIALPMSSNKVQMESSLNLSAGRMYYEQESTPANEIAGAKFKLKKGRKLAMVFDGYLQRLNEVDENGGKTEEEYTLNQLYISHRMGTPYKLTVGRQRVLWGHGLSFVATDFVNPPLDPSRLDLTNAKGVDSVSLDYFASNNSFTLLANLSDENQRTGFGVKWTTNTIDGADFNFVYYNAAETDNALGLSVSADPVRWFIEDSKGEFNTTLAVGIKQKSEYRAMVNRDTEFNGSSINCSYMDENKKEGDSFVSAMFGVAYEWIDSRVSLRSETYYLQEGYDRKELESFYQSTANACALATPVIGDFTQTVPGRVQKHYSTLSIGQDPITEGSGNRFTDNFSYAVGFTRGNEDRSTITTLSFRSRYFDSTEIALDFLFPDGDHDTEFGAIPMDQQITIGVTIAF